MASREQIGSLEAEDTISEVMNKYSSADEFMPRWWRWGYGIEELIVSGPHHWDAGVLFGYWLAPEEEYEQAQGVFEQIETEVRELDILKDITIKPYEVGKETYSFLGEPPVNARGEKWAFHFAIKVVYDHRE